MYIGIYFIIFYKLCVYVFNLFFRYSLKDDFDKEIFCVVCYLIEDSFVIGCDNGKIIYW